MAIKDLTDGGFIEGLHALLEKKSVMYTKSNKPFLKATLRDESGSVDAVCWNFDPANDVLKEGDVIWVSGQAGAYNGIPQITINDFGRSDKKADDFARWTHMDIEQIWGDVVDVVGGFTEPLTKFVAEELLLKHQSMIDAFKRAPAAKSVHNNWYGGLLEHVWSLCQIAKPVVLHYQKHYLQKISMDKVLFGLIFHDAGKIVEYDYRSPAFGFTPVGTFTNHLVLGPAWVYEQANKFRTESVHAVELSAERFKIERAHLMHVLAAHHGQIEWGSPVKPASIEAILVHHLDNLDSKVLHAYDFIANKPGDMEGFSQSSYIEKTAFYNYKEA